MSCWVCITKTDKSEHKLVLICRAKPYFSSHFIVSCYWCDGAIWAISLYTHKRAITWKQSDLMPHTGIGLKKI